MPFQSFHSAFEPGLIFEAATAENVEKLSESAFRIGVEVLASLSHVSHHFMLGFTFVLGHSMAILILVTASMR